MPEDVDIGKGGGRAEGGGYGKENDRVLTGWVSYSWSKSERRFDHVNNREWFPFEYDRWHKLNVTTNYTLPIKERCKFNKSFSINFTLATGNYISIGKQFYHAAPMPESFQTDADNTQYREYIERPNNFRMPAYHHLDISYALDNRKEREVHGYSAFIICMPVRILLSYTTNKREKG